MLKTHFGTGKTGSSTVRRTLASLLRQKLKLNPIPRNKSDIQKGRNAFKLDDTSEKKLTAWMKSNLMVSFYPIDKIAEVQKVEHKLIQELLPVLNLESNPGNPYKSLLSKKRKECAEIALGNKSKLSAVSSRKAKANVAKNKMKARKRRYELSFPTPSKNKTINPAVSEAQYFSGFSFNSPLGCIIKLVLIVVGVIFLIIMIGFIANQ